LQKIWRITTTKHSQPVKDPADTVLALSREQMKELKKKKKQTKKQDKNILRQIIIK
jgi:hypothetical protein